MNICIIMYGACSYQKDKQDILRPAKHTTERPA